MPSQSDIRQQVTDQILAALKSGLPPWKSLTGPHRNVVSTRSYSGINILLCEIGAQRFGFSSSIWGTFDQWKELGGSVKKCPDDVKPGSWGTSIIFTKLVVKKKQDDVGTETQERWQILKT